MSDKIKEWDDLPTVPGWYWMKLRNPLYSERWIRSIGQKSIEEVVSRGGDQFKYYGPLHPPEDENEACGRFEEGERTNGGCQGNGYYFCRKCSELDPDSDMLKE